MAGTPRTIWTATNGPGDEGQARDQAGKAKEALSGVKALLAASPPERFG